MEFVATAQFYVVLYALLKAYWAHILVHLSFCFLLNVNWNCLLEEPFRGLSFLTRGLQFIGVLPLPQICRNDDSFWRFNFIEFSGSLCFLIDLGFVCILAVVERGREVSLMEIVGGRSWLLVDSDVVLWLTCPAAFVMSFETTDDDDCDNSSKA